MTWGKTRWHAFWVPWKSSAFCSFPNSYSSPVTFRESLVRNLNLDVSVATVRKILKDTALYQAHFPRRKNLYTRHLYLRGSGITGLAGKAKNESVASLIFWILLHSDVAYLPYGEKNRSKQIMFTAVLDPFSKASTKDGNHAHAIPQSCKGQHKLGWVVVFSRSL